MAYFNGNPYRGPAITEVLHDACFKQHPERFEMIGPEGHQLKHQIKPWHWAPVWSLDPDAMACSDCGKPVVGRA